MHNAFSKTSLKLKDIYRETMNLGICFYRILGIVLCFCETADRFKRVII
jgi:hypothetical protein